MSRRKVSKMTRIKLVRTAGDDKHPNRDEAVNRLQHLKALGADKQKERGE